MEDVEKKAAGREGEAGRVTSSPPHLVTSSPPHSVTPPSLHPVTLSPCHLVTLSPLHPFILTTGVLLVAIVLSVAFGAVPIPLQEVAGILSARLAGRPASPELAMAETI